MAGKTTGVMVGIPIVALLTWGVSFGVLKGNVNALERDMVEVKQAPVEIATLKTQFASLDKKFDRLSGKFDSLDEKLDEFKLEQKTDMGAINTNLGILLDRSKPNP